MITPLDIENKRFQKSGRKGYFAEEVDDFLDELSVDYAKLYKEVKELKDELENKDKELEHYKNIEQTLQNTLVMAQTTAEDIKNIARKQADQLIKDAEESARASVDALNKEETERRRSFEDLKKQMDVYKAKMEALLISQLEMLRDPSKDIH